MNSASQGDKALASSDFPSAIRYFTQALVELPRAPTYYIKRSTAYSRVKPTDGGPHSQAALRDAEVALTLARERGKREIILSAQLRRGIALYQLEKYGDAGYVFGTVQDKTGAEKKDSSDKLKDAMSMAGGARSSAKNGFEQELPIWVLKVKSKLKTLAEGDEKAAVTVAEYPSGVHIPSETELKSQLEALKSGKIAAGNVQSQSVSGNQTAQESTSTTSSDKVNTTTKPSTAPASAAPSSDQVRHEWYQSSETVVVTLYVKGVPKDKVDTELKDESVSLQFPLPSGASYDFTLDPLFAPVDPASSKVSVMSTKIEIVLKKRASAQKWSALEASSTDPKLADRQTATGSTPAPGSAPAYPSSSRHGAKDWDKLASSLTAKNKDKTNPKADSAEQKDDAGDESDAASVDSDFGGGDGVDSFFKKLYANADPDTRRAMVKSYVESQGTSLSTNWSEVGQGKVETRPPSD
ncbi:hypothetical protein BDV25DRAFT_165934 [Aspergillus avenaceus]|uniref:SGT1 and CS domain protein n=1 Tax=Aspergillus avenaceus TaxID=36643 RepID=A0A5N6TFG9_ASPAV|nr:hypothetical protein BDV25DRAFT_165934 [Aspergillus avenaceus]